MPVTLTHLVHVESQLAEALLLYLMRLACELDKTPWFHRGDRIRASAIAVELSVLTEQRYEHFLNETAEPQGLTSYFDEHSPMEELEATCYELPLNPRERQEEPWRQVIRRGRVRLGLRGSPGSGKTFVTRQAVISTARQTTARLQSHSLRLEEAEIPLWIPANTLAETLSQRIGAALVEALNNEFLLELSDGLAAFLANHFESSSAALVVIDALDELSTADRSTFERKAKQLDCVRGRVVATCRTMQWEERRLWLGWQHLTEVDLVPLTLRQQRQFINQFFGSTLASSHTLTSFLHSSYALRAACTNPLLLTFTCLLHDGPTVTERTSYAQLYADIARHLILGEWRSPQSPRPPWVDGGITEERSFRSLESIACHLFYTAPTQNRFTLYAWTVAAQKAAADSGPLPLEPLLLLHHLEQVGFVVPAGFDAQRRDRCWSFVHRTFLEYLTACALSRMPLKVALHELRRHLWYQPEWLEVFRFFAGLVDDITPLIALINTEPTSDDLFGTMLCMKARIIGSAPHVPGDLARTVSDEVVAYWRRVLTAVQWSAYPVFAAVAGNALARDLTVLGLSTYVRDADAAVREAAAEALGELGGEAAVRALLELLKDSAESVRVVAAEALGHIGGDSARTALEMAVRTEASTSERLPSSGMMRHAVAALGRIGTTGCVDALLALTEANSPVVQEMAARVLGDVGNDRAIERLIQLTRSQVAGVAAVAVKALGRLGSPRALDQLLRLSRGTSDSLRTEIAEALGNYSSDAAVQQLVELSRDAKRPIWQAAVKSLGQVGTEAAVQGLLDLTMDADEQRIEAAVVALGLSGNQCAADRLLEMITVTDRDRTRTRLRQLITQSLGRIRPVRNIVIDSLLELTADQELEVRRAAVVALGPLRSDRARNRLLALSSSEDVRNDVIEALGKTADARALDRLIALTAVPTNGREHTCYLAVRALGRFRERRAVECLMTILSHKSWQMRAGAAEALGHIGSEEAIAPLLELLHGKGLHVRKTSYSTSVAHAVRQIGALTEEEYRDLRRTTLYALWSIAWRSRKIIRDKGPRSWRLWARWPKVV